MPAKITLRVWAKFIFRFRHVALFERLVGVAIGTISTAGSQVEDEFDFAALSFGAAFNSVGV